MTGGGRPAAPVEPLAGFEADALLADWVGYRRVALAVSGGADSMALMLLADDWRQRVSTPPAFTILTVDHRLRSESAGEAAWVKHQAARLGLPHVTLEWAGEKPRGDLQAAAREARYALMLNFCRHADIDVLATAHTADDQAETLLMRLARGSGLDGLAAMAPIASRDGVALLRPLLGVARARLEATLRERGESWIEDPSNRDSRYERVRIREALRAAHSLQLTPEALTLSARRLHRARLALDRLTADFLRAALVEHSAGYGELPLAALTEAPAEIGVRAIAHMAGMFGGGMRPVRLARVEALHAAAMDGKLRAATLGGCLFETRRGRLRVAREYGRISPVRISLPAEGPAVWDGRFAIFVGGEAGLAAGPLGPEGVAQLRALSGRILLPARIAHALPAIWRGGGLVFAPFAVFTQGHPPSWKTGARMEFLGGEKACNEANPPCNPRLAD
jgi:tRNA(Ile)-lysidine synthase